MNRPSALHSLTWLLWAVAATAALQLAPSPVYAVVVVAIAWLVAETHRIGSALNRAFTVLVGVGIVFALLRAVLVVLTTHGGGARFATVPEATLPRLLGGFTVGGPLEWAVLWQALAEGLVVVAIMAVFGAFNSVASHYELLQAAPRAFHEPGLVLTVALAFVPATIESVMDAREADRARTGGKVVRRGRAVRLVIPVLETGLERAVDLADSMDSRGFGRGDAGPAQRASAWLGLACLVSLGGTLVALVGGAGAAAAVLAAIGMAALVAAVLLAPVGTAPTRYRPRRLTRLDVAVMVVAALAPVGLAVLAAAGESSLRWTAALPLRPPVLHPLPLLCLAALAVPALVPRVSAEEAGIDERDRAVGVPAAAGVATEAKR